MGWWEGEEVAHRVYGEEKEKEEGKEKKWWPDGGQSVGAGQSLGA